MTCCTGSMEVRPGSLQASVAVPPACVATPLRSMPPRSALATWGVAASPCLAVGLIVTTVSSCSRPHLGDHPAREKRPILTSLFSEEAGCSRARMKGDGDLCPHSAAGLMPNLRAQLAATVGGLKAVPTCPAAGLVLKGQFRSDQVSHLSSRLQQSTDQRELHSVTLFGCRSRAQGGVPS